MNRILFFLLAFSFALSSYAKDRLATIKGKIVNPLADSVSVSYIKDWIEYSQDIINAKVGPDGSFTVKVPVSEDYLQIDIQHGQQSTELFIEPGANLTMYIDGNDFDNSIKYEGTGAALANFMAGHMRDRSFIQEIHSKVQPLYAKEPAEFVPALNELLGEEKAYVEKNGKELPASFKAYWNNYYKYLGYYAMLNYPRIHEMIKQKSYSIGEIPAENYAVLDNAPAEFNDAYLPLSTYRMYAMSYYDAMVSKTKGDPEELSSENMPKGTLEYYLASQYFRYIKYSPIDTTEKHITSFKKQFPTSRYLPLLESKFAIRKSMSPGQPIVDLALVTDEGKKMNLSDLKGKVVFLDFWASWCGPCIAEMPSSKKVREHFAGKDVVFLYISIDDDEAKWKMAIEKHEIKGIHVRQPGGWAAPAAQKYGVQSIPSYFLIDKKGKYALENVPRPKETEKLIAEIEKLL